ncbi:sensor histidine kinase [Actinoplanes sp. URMC 104]|uniref:sensor histidine kinase n=1 Tax=Actinoplanes sp. URMC 104 TaxID=3423409 RepID=UPI003F1AAEC5
MIGRFALTRLKYRVAGGFAILLLLFLALIVAHFVVTERQRLRHEAHVQRVEFVRDTNRAVLQHLTDAETGVRGFQLTGETAFLEPWISGRAGAFGALQRLDADPLDAGTARLVTVERQAADRWLYGYAIPIVNAGVADADAARAARGKDLFDHIRTANADVLAAVEDYEQRVGRRERTGAQLAALLFAGLAALVVAAGAGLAMLHQRHLLLPLEHLRLTLRRLADGDLSARAVPAGPGELRAVAGTLNDLAAETERLITAEQARVARAELRQAVTALLQEENSDPAAVGRRFTGMLATTLDADAAYSRITIRAGEPIEAHWPEHAPPLDPAIAEQARSCAPGSSLEPAGAPGALVIPLSGDAGCAPGLICLLRPARPEWSPEERRLLIGLGREIDHAARQERLRLRQERLINELRMLDEQKDVFVATVTHELRTPLTSILGYSEMLVEDDGHAAGLSPVQRRGIEAIRRNAHRLRDTVADLLLLDGGGERTGAEAVPVDLARLAGEAHAALRTAALAKDLVYELVTEPAWVRGDAVQLERAVHNLLDNAIKFTRPGGRLECRLTATGDRAVVTVTDTGIGIPADDLPGLFTPFHRAANAMDQAVQGNGLGLAIVRTIVNDHGGTVTARSELGRGSTFTMTLPLIRAQAQSVAAPSRSGHA